MAWAAPVGAVKASGEYDKLFDKFGMTRLKDATFAIKGPGPT